MSETMHGRGGHSHDTFANAWEAGRKLVKLLRTAGAASVILISVNGAFAQSVPSADGVPPSLRAARGQDFYELEVKLPHEVEQALNSQRILAPEELRNFLDSQKKKVLRDLQVEVLHDFAYLPVVLVKPPDAPVKNKAKAHPDLRDLRPPSQFHTSINATDSSAQIGAGTMRGLGYDGTGASVLVTDSAIDINSIPADFQCTAIGSPANTCKLASYENWGQADYGHGLNVSGIIALTAPGARIHHRNVSCGSTCIDATLAMNALNWAIQNKNAYNIVAHNMSWGGQDGCSLVAWMSSGTAAGIAQVAASGNDSNSTSAAPLGSPANCSGVFSVGALDTRGSPWTVASFSNASPALGFLAPGSSITAADHTYSGTSQATPHVTALVAMLNAPNQWAGIAPSTLQWIMQTTGTPILDSRSNVNMTFPVPDAFRSRVSTINIVNKDGVAYQVSPAAPRTCGADCFNYPQMTVTVTYPAGYILTGCGKIDATSCHLGILGSGSHRLMTTQAFMTMIGPILFSSQPDNVFANGFEQ